MAKDPTQLIKENDQGKTGRTNFENQWQTIHDFYDNAGSDVNTTYYPGTELTVTQLYDSFSLYASRVLAAGLGNYLTPNASQWFAFRTREPAKMEKKKVLHYLKDVEAEVAHTLNNSNYYDTMPSFYKKSGDYGTSILFQEEDPFDVTRFYSMPMKNVVIVEDARMRVVEYYIEFQYTATQAVTRFGEKKVHKDVLEEHRKGRYPDTKFTYLLYIGPNWHRNPQALNTENKPWIAQWIDVANKIEVERGGFDELPAMTHRFYRRTETVWGISPAMEALMDVRMLNAKAKTQLRAEMKMTDPPIAMPDNAFLGRPNFNPRGQNFYQKDAFSKDSIFPIGDYGNPNIGKEGMEYCKDQIRSHMFTDVFLAFQGLTGRMNNPEVRERIAEKMTLLGPAVGRFLNLNDNVLHRTIAMLDRRGMLPEPPQEIIDDPGYEIEYLSTLARAQRNGELQSLQNALVMVGEMANFSPEVLDKINPDKGVDVVFSITGAPVQMLRDDEEVQAIRDQRREAEASQQEADLLSQGAEIAVNATQASVNARQAEVPV